MNQFTEGDFLTYGEAENMISHQLQRIPIEKYGSKEWLSQHELLERLNVQAHKHAIEARDEFIADLFALHQQMHVLIYDLLVTEIWKAKVYPLISSHLRDLSSMKSYITLYHEATLANLFQVLLYKGVVIEETSPDAFLELIDYCYRKMVALTQIDDKLWEEDTKELLKQNREEEMEKQRKVMEFNLGILAISMLNCISENIESLDMGSIQRLMEKRDFVVLLVELLEVKPWIRRNTKGERLKFENQNWVVIPPNEFQKVPKIEGQIWLSIFKLALTDKSRKAYEITNYRKETLIRLRKYLNEVLLDQIPILTELLKTLEHLAIMAVPPASEKNVFLIEQIPEMYDSISNGKNWKEIGEMQVKLYFQETPESRDEEMRKLADLYDMHFQEGFLDDPKCAKCGKKATNRCSKCKHEWYCSRDCQINCWKLHKPICAILTEARLEKEQAKAEESRKEESVVPTKQKKILEKARKDNLIEDREYKSNKLS